MSSVIPHNGLRGANTEQAALIGLRFQARLKLSSHKRSLSALAGPYRASFRGRGMDFEEVRSYQPGDDVRSIDWRVTARTGDAHTKIFREERERPVFVLADQRQSMYFGSQRCFKSVLAAEVAGLLAWSALKQNDRVGGLVMGSDDVVEVKPKRSKSSVLQFLHSVHQHNHALGTQRAVNKENKTSISSALEDARRVNKPGSAIFIISDFHDFDEKSSKQMFHLAQHNEVTAFMVFDQLEQQLPPSGSYEVTDGASKGLLNTQSKEIRTKYQQLFEQKQTDLQHNLAKSGVPLVTLETGCDALNELMKYYTYQRGHN